MTIAKIRNCYKTLVSKLNNNSISLDDAKEKAIILLSDAMDLKNNSAELDVVDQFKLETLINCIDELIKKAENVVSC